MQPIRSHRGALAPLAIAIAIAGGCGSDGDTKNDDAGTMDDDDAGTMNYDDAGTMDDDGGEAPEEKSVFALGSVVIDAEGNRTTYVQAVDSLDDGPFDNKSAIEIAGNSVFLAGQKHFFIGGTEEPTWTRYTPDGKGGFEKNDVVSLARFGSSRIDYGNAYVDEETAVSVFSDQGIAVVWNPKTMKVVGEIDLGHLIRDDGWDLEVWTTSTHDRLVYIPGRWAKWPDPAAGETVGDIHEGVSVTIVDPEELEVVGVAEDERCSSGGFVVFDEEGYGYVMGDGRNYILQTYAIARDEEASENCLLRIAPGETDFEEDYYYTIPSLTDGRDSITELETAVQGSGVAFSKMIYKGRLADGIDPGFEFWDERAFKMWRIELADPPVAKPVEDIPFSAVGFNGKAVSGYLYSGESTDGGATTDVYEIDPEKNQAKKRFTMDGYFNGLYELKL